MNNKYQEALDSIKNTKIVCRGMVYECSDCLYKQIKILQELVSNESLKLEEIKDKKQIWDIKYNAYVLVDMYEQLFDIYWIEFSEEEESNERCETIYKKDFEEGRFFPWEVK